MWLKLYFVVCIEGYTQSYGSCERCLKGNYKNNTGNQACLLCPAGSYNNVSGQIFCTSCESGFYSPEPGYEECLSCSGTVNGQNTDCGKWNEGIQVFICNTNLTFMYNIDIGRFLESFKQQTKLLPVGIKHTTPIITGLEVWCGSNSIHQSFLASLRLSNPYKVTLYWIQTWSKSKKWSGSILRLFLQD